MLAGYCPIVSVSCVQAGGEEDPGLGDGPRRVRRQDPTRRRERHGLCHPRHRQPLRQELLQDRRRENGEQKHLK